MYTGANYILICVIQFPVRRVASTKTGVGFRPVQFAPSGAPVTPASENDTAKRIDVCLYISW